MKQTAYLSLGSNEGNRLAFLQKALQSLDQLPLQIEAQSHIYETPAWGFDGPSFLNACVTIKTDLSPQELLAQMLLLEKQLGRFRGASKGYQSRTIDLDLLGYEDQVIKEDGLTVPHPLLHQREFVLRPLAEIAPLWQHPVLEQTPQILLAQFDHQTAVKRPFSEWSPPLFSSFSFLAIEGNIGSGKTTLTHQLANTFTAIPFLESYSNNPHLASFYENPKAYAKAVETFFLRERIKAIEIFWRENQDKAVVADFSIHKSLVFAKQNLTPTDFNAFSKWYAAQVNALPIPQLILYLDTPVDYCLRRIEQRGRTYEKNISPAYLQQIALGYADFFLAHEALPVIKIAVGDRDFKNNPHHFQWLLRRIIAASISK